MTQLLILACSAAKRTDPGEMPAVERYDGPAFRVLRRQLRERPGLAGELTICILSAKHGLIAGDTPLEDYDLRLTRARAEEIAPAVAAVLDERIRTGQPAGIFIAAGWRYRHLLFTSRELMAADGRQIVRQVNGGIGFQCNQLYNWLHRLKLQSEGDPR